MNVTNSTIEYYNKNAETYIESTIDADMSDAYHKFLSYLKPGMSIFDIGCGSGRDSKYFIESGFKVTAMDGSKEFCKFASKLIKQDVLNICFDDINFIEQFDSAWACSSLLHVTKDSMNQILRNISHSLKVNGILYVSYKYGTEERAFGDRLFSDYTENDIPNLFFTDTEFKCLEWWISSDVRTGRENEKWLNIIAEKAMK